VSSFAQKLLRVKFTLSNGAIFPAGTPGSPANVLTLVGLRTLAQILCAGSPAFPQCDLTVFGMAQSDMNALSSLTFEVTGVNRNTVQIDASSDGGVSFSTVYTGQITSAHIEYRPPEAGLRVLAQMAFFDQINPATPTSYPGSTDVATIVSTIASKMNFAFENNGVTAQTGGPVYYPGVLTEQLRDVTSHYGIDWYMESGASSSLVQTLAICPKGAARGTPTFNLSPQSGLVDYPAVDSRGYIHARALYSPAFRFGGPLTISGSDVVIDPNAPKTLNSKANGNWMVGQMTHTLDALKFDGQWHSTLLLYPPGQEPPQS
jgi:hypothetical protein